MVYYLGKVTLLLLFLIFPSVAFGGDVWRIASLEWGKYSGASQINQGKSIHKLRTLLKQAEIDLIVEFYPWARAKRIAAGTDYVGYYPAWPEEVGDGFFASPAVDHSLIAVMTYADSGLVWKGLEDVFMRRVGLVSSYVYPESVNAFAEMYAENVDSTVHEESLVRKLSEKRFSAAITDPDVMFTMAEKLGIDNVRLMKILGEMDLVIAFRNTPENEMRNALLKQLLKQKMNN